MVSSHCALLLNTTLGSLGAAILDVKFWYIIFQQARPILPQVSFCIAARYGRVGKRCGLAGKHCHAASSKAARPFGTSSVSKSSQTTDDEDPPRRPGAGPGVSATDTITATLTAKTTAPKIGAINRTIWHHVLKRTRPPRAIVRLCSAEHRRCGSSSPHRPAAGGRSSRTGGRTGCWGARARWIPTSTLGSLSRKGSQLPPRDLGTIYVYQIPPATALFA
jgi:hypothetical protein